MHTTDRAEARALFSDGNKTAISSAMIATTTKSSTRVKAERIVDCRPPE